jgi:archaellum component FlaC
LSREEQLKLIQQLTEQVSTESETPAKPKRTVNEFYGVAPDLLSGIDAQVWVDQLRSEWDERESMFRQQP